jgi:hypothetical protein
MSDPQIYERIAKRFAYELPKEYRSLHERGWLTLDRPASSISATPGDGYLFMHEMEWYGLEEIATFDFPEFYRPHLQGLVPFAFNGAGDYWCWQCDKTDEHGTRVLLCYHDTGSAVIFAPNFETALYRQALAYATYWVGSDHVGLDEGRAYLHRWAIDLAAIFSPGWSKVISDLSTRQPVEWRDRQGRHTTLLSPEERRHIEVRDAKFNEMDSEIIWANLPTA